MLNSEIPVIAVDYETPS